MECQSGKSVNRTMKILSKKDLSSNGLNVKESLDQLNSSISQVKGLLAILLSKHQSASTNVYPRLVTDQEHSRILLQEAMGEIWISDQTIQLLKMRLEKKFFGICLR
jgi:hypothetical protein